MKNSVKFYFVLAGIITGTPHWALSELQPDVRAFEVKNVRGICDSDHRPERTFPQVVEVDLAALMKTPAATPREISKLCQWEPKTAFIAAQP